MSIRRTPSAVLFFTLISLCAHSQDLPERRLDSLLDKAVELGVFSGNVLVEKNGTITFERSRGMADAVSKAPNDKGTMFQIASITKDFTRTMILQLHEQGRLILSDPISKYLTGFTPEVSAVNIGQLLYFTSGLGDYHTADAYRSMAGRVVTIEEVLGLVRKEKLEFTPGTRFRYSNSSYVVLAAIIEKVTGRTYMQALRSMVLDKCGMKHTGGNGIPRSFPAWPRVT